MSKTTHVPTYDLAPGMEVRFGKPGARQWCPVRCRPQQVGNETMQAFLTRPTDGKPVVTPEVDRYSMWKVRVTV